MPSHSNSCEMLDPKKRCDRKSSHMNMSDVPAWAPGDLNKLFENIMTDERWAVFSPKALSQPPAGPWIVQFDNVIEEAEANALIATVQNKVLPF